MTMTISEERRFFSKVRLAANGCWEWTGCRERKGYGRFHFRGRTMYAHAVSLVVFHGKTPPKRGSGWSIDHSCNNEWCVNPAHIRVISMRENILRGNGMGARWARRSATV